MSFSTSSRTDSTPLIGCRALIMRQVPTKWEVFFHPIRPRQTRDIFFYYYNDLFVLVYSDQCFAPHFYSMNEQPNIWPRQTYYVSSNNGHIFGCRVAQSLRWNLACYFVSIGWRKLRLNLTDANESWVMAMTQNRSTRKKKRVASSPLLLRVIAATMLFFFSHLYRCTNQCHLSGAICIHSYILSLHSSCSQARAWHCMLHSDFPNTPLKVFCRILLQHCTL